MRTSRPTPVPLRRALARAVASALAGTALAGAGLAGVGVAEERGWLTPTLTWQESVLTHRAPAPAPQERRLERRLERLQAAHRCSSTGLAPGVVPVHAVVRVEGRLRLVGFEEGWSVHRGRAAGTLVSVCAR